MDGVLEALPPTRSRRPGGWESPNLHLTNAQMLELAELLEGQKLDCNSSLRGTAQRLRTLRGKMVELGHV